MRIIHLAFALALLSPSAHANWTCIATCQSADDASQISSNSFPSRAEAKADLANYCPRTYIENVRCFQKGNPGADGASGFLHEAASAYWCVTCYLDQNPVPVLGDSQAEALQNCHDEGGVPVFASVKRCEL